MMKNLKINMDPFVLIMEYKNVITSETAIYEFNINIADSILCDKQIIFFLLFDVYMKYCQGGIKGIIGHKTYLYENDERGSFVYQMLCKHRFWCILRENIILM